MGSRNMTESPLKSGSKYFLHGIAFSILYLALAFVWVILLVVLVIVGFFIGLIVGLVLLFFIVGGLNSFLTNLIWSVPIKTDWKSLLLHGLVLFTLLLIANIPNIIVNFLFRNLGLQIVLFLIYAFVDGFVARNSANWWKKPPEEYELLRQTPKSFLKKCLNCGQEIPIASETCPYCGSKQQ